MFFAPKEAPSFKVFRESSFGLANFGIARENLLFRIGIVPTSGGQVGQYLDGIGVVVPLLALAEFVTFAYDTNVLVLLHELLLQSPFLVLKRLQYPLLGLFDALFRLEGL